VIRTIDGFHCDDAGDWVAELSCLHNQHVRHRPPFSNRAWVESETGRRERLGSDIECALCNRAELPNDLGLARTAGPFDETTLPAALQHAHRVAERTWGQVRVLDGSVTFVMELTPQLVTALRKGESQPIPPGVPHELRLEGPVQLEIDFLAKPPEA